MAIDRRQQVLGSHRLFLGVLAVVVRRSDDLAHVLASAGEQNRHGIGPVVSSPVEQPAIIVPLLQAATRRTTEFAGHHHQGFLVHSTLVQIFNQGGHPLIKSRQPLAHGGGQIPVHGMVVPVINQLATRHTHGDKLDPCFDQSAGGQSLLSPASAIAIPHGLWFLGDIKCFTRPAAGQDVDGLMVDRVERIHDAVDVQVAAESIQLPENLAP